MKRILFLLSRLDDIPIARRPATFIVSTSPEVSSELLRLHVPFQDIGLFYPLPKKSVLLQKKLTSFVQSWYQHSSLKEHFNIDGVNVAKAAMFGLHMHLGEIGHSILTAERLLNHIKPDRIYGSTAIQSLPFRRYDDEFLSYEGWAVELLAKQKHIPFFRVGKALLLWPSCAWALSLRLRSVIKSLSTFKTTQYPPSKPITFLGNYYQLINLLPTLEECQKQKLQFMTIGKATPKQHSELTKKGIPFVPLSELETHYRSYMLRATFHFLSTWFSTKHDLQHRCNDVHPLLWIMLKPKVFWYFLVEFPELATLSKNVKELFSPRAKTLITMATSDHVSRIIALTAQHSNVNVVELQHGFYLLDFEYFLRSNDYFLLWNENVRDILKRTNEAPRRYPIASYPWFDQYRSIDYVALRKQGLQKIQPPPNATILLMLVNMPNDLDDDRLTLTSSHYQYVSVIFSELAKKPGTWYVVFRPHPSCASRWVINLAAYYGISFFYDDRSIPLSEIIAASNIVVANFTTALLDTMFLKKPILFYTFRNGIAAAIDRFANRYGIPWKRFTTRKEFSQLLQVYLTDISKRKEMIKSQQKLLHAQIPFRELSSANEIIKFIGELSQS